jgi:CDP-diacylglycerol--glycerol-3-phosphate 3-phosphatidyltransferase
MKNLPNILTLGRILLLPVIIGLVFIDQAVISLCLYIIASLTDFIDGYLARKLNVVSEFGAFLDPIADKIFVAALLITFVAFDRLEGIWIVVPIVILLREFMVSGLREYLGPKNIKLPVSTLAKWKTTIQMIAVGFLFFDGGILLQIGQWSLAVAAIVTLITGWDYLKTGLKHMKS